MEKQETPEILETESQKEKITLEDFSMICMIGEGSYAKVILVKKKDTKKLYALKIMKDRKSVV